MSDTNVIGDDFEFTPSEGFRWAPYSVLGVLFSFETLIAGDWERCLVLDYRTGEVCRSGQVERTGRIESEKKRLEEAVTQYRIRKAIEADRAQRVETEAPKADAKVVPIRIDEDGDICWPQVGDPDSEDDEGYYAGLCNVYSYPDG